MRFPPPPKIQNLLKDELYQVQRECIALEDKLFRLNILQAQTQAALQLTTKRQLELEERCKGQNPQLD